MAAAKAALTSGATVTDMLGVTAMRRISGIPVDAPSESFVAPVDTTALSTMGFMVAKYNKKRTQRPRTRTPSVASLALRSTTSRSSRSSRAPRKKIVPQHPKPVLVPVPTAVPGPAAVPLLVRIKRDPDRKSVVSGHSASLGDLRPVSSWYSSDKSSQSSLSNFNDGAAIHASTAGAYNEHDDDDDDLVPDADLPHVLPVPGTSGPPPATAAAAVPAPSAPVTKAIFNDDVHMPPPSSLLRGDDPDIVAQRDTAKAVEALLEVMQSDSTVTLAEAARIIIGFQEEYGFTPMSLEEARGFVLERVPRMRVALVDRFIMNELLSDERDNKRLSTLATVRGRLSVSS